LPVAAKLANPKSKQNEYNWVDFNYLTFIRLLPRTNQGHVIQKILEIYAQNLKNENKTEVGLLPLSKMHFENNLESSSLFHGDYKTVYVFSVLGILLLLIALYQLRKSDYCKVQPAPERSQHQKNCRRKKKTYFIPVCFLNRQ
jgi:hypothetical protein